MENDLCPPEIRPHEALARIARPGTDITLWERHLDAALEQELAALKLAELDDLTLECTIPDLAAGIAQALDDAGYPHCPALRRDIAMLARCHAEVLAAERIRLRLEVIETDACRRFHADFVTVRTITTYLGRGTQWTQAPGSDWQPEMIRELSAGTVAMFKGRLLQPEPSILHRSPPIAESGESRLVLVIDSMEAR